MNINKDHYENIVFQHDFQRTHLTDSLEIVKKFILLNKRILVGGMAIDFSLRNKKDKLYSEFKLPDYDFLSPEFHKDAYTIGEQIAATGITGVSVIRGLHTSTMRVRVNFVPVADISYVPENIYNSIPTIKYQGYTVVHPHYQMIDQHLSLSQPYENAPFETIMQRWDKDMERYDLLYKYYSLDDISINIKYKNIKSYTIPISILKDCCIGGFGALQYWLSKAKSLRYKIDNEFDWKIDDQSILIDISSDLAFTIYTVDYKDIIKRIDSKNITYYNSILDKIQRRVVIDKDSQTYEIIDTLGKRISAYYDKELDCYIANLQTIMCHMLTLYIMYKNEYALSSYQIAKNLLNWACKEYISKSNLISGGNEYLEHTYMFDGSDSDSDGDNKSNNKDGDTKYKDGDKDGDTKYKDGDKDGDKDVSHNSDKDSNNDTKYKNSDNGDNSDITSDKNTYKLFLPTAEVYGTRNFTLSYLLSHIDMDSKIDKKQIPSYTPRNAYPIPNVPIKKELYDFNPNDSLLYQIDGKITESFKSI